MSRSASQYPITDAGRSAASLDREIEASLHRQFAIPAVTPMPAEGFARLDMGPWYAGWSLRLPSQPSLRQAAGLLLAASLWGGSGFILFSHLHTGQGTRTASAVLFAPALDLNSPLGQVVRQFETAQYNIQDDDSVNAAQRQEQLWRRLESELSERSAVPVDGRLRELRQGASRVELLAVDEPEFIGEGMLLVAARVEGRLSVALIEPSEQERSSIVYAGFNSGVAEPPPAGSIGPQLFASRLDTGFGYELTEAGEPTLVPMLFPDAQLDGATSFYPARYRGLAPVIHMPPDIR